MNMPPSSRSSSAASSSGPFTLGIITEFAMDWPTGSLQSTHELVTKDNFIYITGQNNNAVARFDISSKQFVYYSTAVTANPNNGSVPSSPPSSSSSSPPLFPADVPYDPTQLGAMPGNGPHGLLIDGDGNVWVSLEFKGTVVRLSGASSPIGDGVIVEEIDVGMHIATTPPPSVGAAAGTPTVSRINTAPHGICIGADGQTIWFTGKRTSTIGRINPDRSVEHFQLNTLAALPIFLNLGPDGGIWGTELYGSAILHATTATTSTAASTVVVNEYAIPTGNSRPIGIIPDFNSMGTATASTPSDPSSPSSPSSSSSCMWFTEEAGVKVGRIDVTTGAITEYAVPSLQRNDILGSLSFDAEGNLWVQVWASASHPISSVDAPPNRDYILKIDKSIRSIPDGSNDTSGVSFTPHSTPSRSMSMLHRIRLNATDGNLWYTAMMTDRLGVIHTTGN